MSEIAGGERDLDTMLERLEPRLHPGEYVFATSGDEPDDLDPFATVREAEGLTLVVERGAADRARLEYDFVAARITLGVHSALDAVGLTAVVATRLADAQISCNVIAGYHHDHLFVPADRAEEAMRLLESGH